MSDPALIAEDACPDPSVVRAEERLAMLRELAEIGMKLAGALEPGEAAADAKTRAKDPAAVFAPLSRAIRMTLSLEAKTDEELRDLKAGVVRAREEERKKAVERAGRAAGDAEMARYNQVEEIIFGAALDEIEDDERREEVMEALAERLEQDDAYMDLVDLPLRETIERLCRDLMLNPDWSRWDGEGWGPDPTGRSRFSPFNTPSARPLLKGDAPPARPPAHDLE